MPSNKSHKSAITKIENSQQENQQNPEYDTKLSEEIKKLTEEIKKLTQDKQNLSTENQNLHTEIQNLRTENQNLRTEIQNLKSNQKPNNKEIDNIKITLGYFIKGFLTILIFGIVKPYYKCCVYNFPGLVNLRDEEYNWLIKKLIFSFNCIIRLIEKQDPFLKKIIHIEKELNDPTNFVSRYIGIYISSKNISTDTIKSAEEELVYLFNPIFAYIIKYEIHEIENISLKMNQKQLKESSKKSNKIDYKTILKEKEKIKQNNVKEIDSTSTVCTNPSLNTANLIEKMSIKKKENSLNKNITGSNTIIDNKRSVMERNCNNINSNLLDANYINIKPTNLNNVISSTINADDINSELIEVNNINLNKIDQSNINSNAFETKSTNSNLTIDANTKNSSIVANTQSKSIDRNNKSFKNADENKIDLNSGFLNTTTNNSRKVNTSQSNGSIESEHFGHSILENEQYLTNLTRYFTYMIDPKYSNDIDPSMLKLVNDAEKLTNVKIINKSDNGELTFLNNEFDIDEFIDLCREALQKRNLKK